MPFNRSRRSLPVLYRAYVGSSYSKKVSLQKVRLLKKMYDSHELIWQDNIYKKDFNIMVIDLKL